MDDLLSGLNFNTSFPFPLPTDATNHDVVRPSTIPLSQIDPKQWEALYADVENLGRQVIPAPTLAGRVSPLNIPRAPIISLTTQQIGQVPKLSTKRPAKIHAPEKIKKWATESNLKQFKKSFLANDGRTCDVVEELSRLYTDMDFQLTDIRNIADLYFCNDHEIQEAKKLTKQIWHDTMKTLNTRRVKWTTEVQDSLKNLFIENEGDPTQTKKDFQKMYPGLIRKTSAIDIALKKFFSLDPAVREINKLFIEKTRLKPHDWIQENLETIKEIYLMHGGDCVKTSEELKNTHKQSCSPATIKNIILSNFPKDIAVITVKNARQESCLSKKLKWTNDRKQALLTLHNKNNKDIKKTFVEFNDYCKPIYFTRYAIEYALRTLIAKAPDTQNSEDSPSDSTPDPKRRKRD